ncbi:MAG TPA: hypothetical protein VKB38_17980 [Terracidiphilus sp.]|nr:hypothetical protein [Terracidiphilus sp.]
MYSKRYLAAGILAVASTVAFASSPAIATVTTRGDMRIDGYAVSGNATLFDGSAIETSQATATLRLEKGTEIRLGTGSMGTLYRDHMVLQHGKSELSTSDSFALEASGFKVVPAVQNARGVVAVNGLGNIEVAALSGEFEVTSGTGHVIGKVMPGSAKSFAFQSSGLVTVTGKVSQTSGHFFVTDSTGILHELTGKSLSKYVGKTATIDGTLDAGAKPINGAADVIAVSGAHLGDAAGANAGGQVGSGSGLGGAAAVVIGGTAAIFGIEEGIYQSTKSPASR